jgi:hypothetical protein
LELKVITPVRVASERKAEQHGGARIGWTAALRGSPACDADAGRRSSQLLSRLPRRVQSSKTPTTCAIFRRSCRGAEKRSTK